MFGFASVPGLRTPGNAVPEKDFSESPAKNQAFFQAANGGDDRRPCGKKKRDRPVPPHEDFILAKATAEA
jgi:hypothetical protein